MSTVGNQVMDAMDIIVDNKVQKAGYDKTIQAQILSCEDETIGKYKCRYQDSIFDAYSNGTEMSFSNGSFVYILVPNNDMSKEKTILGSTTKLGINYISQAVGDQAYNIVGNNYITSNDKFYLNTNNKDYCYVLYDKNNKNITLDEEGLKQAILQSSSLIVGATFKTSILPPHQYRGHYGITYKINFLDNATGDLVTRSYTVDEDNMVGNPYRLSLSTRQYQIFDIDGQSFDSLESIQIFNKDFPEASGDNENKIIESDELWDIQISNLELNGAIRMSQSEINGVAISFYTPQGIFFTENSTEKDFKTITAQIRIKGKLASAVQKIPFYWGREHVGITTRSEKYNKYLGRGWQCLNESNIVSSPENEEPVVEWVPGKDTYILNFNSNLPKDNKFKVAIVYDGTVVAKQINIQNLHSKTEIKIESSNGTQFYYDIGETDLTCKIIKTVGSTLSSDYIYYWGYVDNKGNFQTILSSSEKNQIIVKASDITAFSTYKCSVYSKENEQYVGTAAITLNNSLEGEGVYSLVINNGTATFQYNENGIAPTNGSLENPLTLGMLSFTIYDNLGQPINIDFSKARDCEIEWTIPKSNTLLLDSSSNEGENVQTNEYIKYKNIPSLVYNIASRYDIRKQNNQIKLAVKYKEMNLTAETAFTFVKQGQPGTNGTEYVVKLVPNSFSSSSQPLYPMITKIGTSGNNEKYELNYSIQNGRNTQKINITKNSQQPFLKAELWRSGQLIWEGTSTNNIKDGFSPVNVRWEVLKNDKDDPSLFEITNNSKSGYTWKINNIPYDNKEGFEIAYSNIIKCTITIKDTDESGETENKRYYGTMPVITAWVSNDTYRIKLKDYTGFRYVMYDSDGTHPQYDNSHPFEFLLSGGEEGTEYVYIPSSTNKNLLIPATAKYRRKDDQPANQWDYDPANRYNGESVNGSVTCEIRKKVIIDGEQSQIPVGRINIPIHFLLNRFGLSHLNDWDGNSIEINKEGGHILSPQMGAGKKNDDNTFTGLLMGQVKTGQKSEVGLLGYCNGQRTIFLNSENGSAIFGKAASNNNENSGQIIVDPSARALLYSNNFWKNYNDKGLPASYDKTNRNTTGLLIDLSQPQITFGNGNFYVTKEGYLHAANGGDLAGWQIGKDDIHSLVKESEGRVTLHSSGKIYSHSHSELNNSGTGFYLSADGLSIGSKVKITNDGIMHLGSGAVKGSGSHWTIDGNDSNSYIAYGGTQWYDANPDEKQDANHPEKVAKVYIGTNGISLGKTFSVNTNGSMSAYDGLIGGWKIGLTALTGGKLKLDSNGSISGGSTYDWSIGTNGEANFNRIIANGSGSIGGWTIGSTYLKGGSLTLNNTGAISGDNWSIAADGTATFKNTFSVQQTFNFTGTLTGSGSIGRSGSLSGGGSSWSGNGMNLGKDTTTIGNKNINAYFKDIAIDGVLKYQGTDVGWKWVKFISDVSVPNADIKSTQVMGPNNTPITINYFYCSGFSYTKSQIYSLCKVQGA